MGAMMQSLLPRHAPATQHEGNMVEMPEDKVRAALKARGWTLHIRTRRARSFAYAAKRGEKERYLAALDAPNLLVLIEALPNVAQRPLWEEVAPAQEQPLCATVFDEGLIHRHVPDMTQPGGYDCLGMYWCAACADRLDLMKKAEQLGWPEISYFPHNPEGLRAVQIQPGIDQWRKRLPVMGGRLDNVHKEVQRLLREQARNVTQQPS
jgi:hypothetical protein